MNINDLEEIKERTRIQGNEIQTTYDHRFRSGYLMVCSNLRKLFKNLELTEFEFYNKWVFYNRIRKYHEKQYDKNTVITRDLEKLSKTPAIYISFHFGSYRVIHYLLQENKIKTCLLINKHVYESEGGRYFKYKEVEKDGFVVLCVEDSQSILKAKEYINKGFSLFFYFDGNSGVGDTRDSKNSIYASFFGNEICSRTGVARLSKLFNLPIVPIIALIQKNLNSKIHLLDSILPSQYKSRGEYETEVTRYLWKILEGYVKKYPTQWEGWSFINKYIIGDIEVETTLPHSSKSHLYKYNNARYDIFINDGWFLFDLEKGLYTHITEILFDCIRYFKENNVALKMDELLDLFSNKKSLVDDLVKKQILI